MAKDRRLNIRLSEEDDDLIREAAALRDSSVSEFLLEAALLEGERTLADNGVIELDNDAWEKFNALLDRPPQHLAGLEKLLATKPVWEE